MLAAITPVILTRDEAPNIGRTLAQLSWAGEVIVVDSLSTDATLAIARSFPNVRIVQRAFDSHAAQWTFAVSLAHTEWVLTLDADYLVTDDFRHELETLVPAETTAGYEARFVYAVHGRPLRASLYPPRPVLLRRDSFEFWQDGHTQRVRPAGPLAMLASPLVHDDRKPFAFFLERQRRYMRQEAEKLAATPWREAGLAGRVRKLVVLAPFAAAFQALFVRRGILDGRAGFTYAIERFVAELILSRELFKRWFV
jgi:glycosyltransferase involved in cell wall biosynthesis